MSIQWLYGALAADGERNRQIVDDVIAALEAGRSPILLTERKDHLEYFAAALRKVARHVIVLQGGKSAKERRVIAAQLAAIPDTEERIVLATGRYIDPERPDLADLAELEWARNEVFFAPESEAMEAEALATLPPEVVGRTRLRMSPSLRVLLLAHDAAVLWRRLECGEDVDPPLAAPTAVAVWRRGFEVFHCALQLHEASALRVAMDGGTLDGICAHFAELPDPAEEAHAAISSWFGEQWVAGVAPAP